MNPEQFVLKKELKYILKTITFYLEIDNHEEVNFNQVVLTFTLQWSEFELLNELLKV